MSFQRSSTLYSLASITAVFLILVILFSIPALAQVSGGTLSGTITDPSGGGIALATLVIKNIATGVERTVTTNTDGFYTAVNLLPGSYEVTISAKGFNTEVKTGVTMTVGARQSFDVVMRVGTVANRVEVTSEAPAVQLTSSDISAVVNETTVRELPLNGRSWTDLAALQPGVDTIQSQSAFSAGPDRGNRGFGQQLTISGARPQQNNYRLDGVSLNDYANGAPGSVLGGNLGVDAIQEFSVLTSNYSAEYGKTSGGVVNAITRSGTNAFHGSLYEFLRNSALDAKNYFENPSLPKATFKRNQFGGAIGGPIIKNRTFFFADYEGIRQAKGIPNLLNVPSPEVRADPTVDPTIKKYFALYPTVASCAGADICQTVFTGLQVVNEDFFTGRADHKFSEKDSVFGTYLYDKTPYHSPDAFGNVELFSLTSRQILAVEETHSFTPTFINAARFGFNHQNTNNNKSVADLSPGKIASDITLGAFQASQGFQDRAAPSFIVSGLTPFSGGFGGSPTYFYGWNSFQGYDDAFLTRGTHSIKFGADVERMHMEAQALTDVNGIFFFGAFRDPASNKDFLHNSPTKFNGGVASTLKPRNFRQTIFGAYVQDDWRWKPNLTLNLGVRYEMATVMSETNGRLVNLRNITDVLPACGTPDPLCGSVGPLFANPTLWNFEPRFGFSWDPLKTGRLAVRGGAGLFDVLPLPYQFILLETQSVPFFNYLSLSKNADGSNLQVGPLPKMDAGGTRLRSTFIDSHPKRNYVMQWNLNVQYSLTPNLTGMVAYVGSRGVHQPYRVDEANLVIPMKLTSGGYIWPKVDALGNVFTPQCNQLDPNGKDPLQCAPPPIVNQNFSSIRGMFYKGLSYYNALELQLAKRMSHGFQAQGTFTWGKSIDTSSATLAGDAFLNSISSLHYFDTKLTRGPADFNVGRTLVLNANWEVPGQKSWSGPAKWVTDGWELGLIFTASDGIPFTPTWGFGADPAGTLSQDDWTFPNLVRGAPGCNGHLTNPGNPGNYVNTNCFAIPTAPDSTFWANNCTPVPISKGTAVDPASLQCYNLRGNIGRNTLIGPGITSLDFSVFKNNRVKRISENFNVQFRVEMFNLLNHPNFGVPSTTNDGNTDIFDGTGRSQSPLANPPGIAGQLVRTTVSERQIQAALKIVF